LSQDRTFGAQEPQLKQAINFVLYIADSEVNGSDSNRSFTNA